MDVIKNIIEYFAILLSVIILVSRTNYVLKYYQQSHYKLSIYKKTFKHYYFGSKQYLVWIVLIFIVFLGKWYVQLIYGVYILGLFILFSKQKDIIKLKITPRIYRIYFVILVIGTLFSSATLLVFELPELVASLGLIIFILPLLIFLASVITLPIEELIAYYYQRKAKTKLDLYRPDVIGITGSFGKTSTKNILYEFIKERKITLATKKSYNTLNGVSISINNDLTINDEVFIVEMGASKIGDISALVKLAPPTHAILTGITAQHIESFKSISNVVSEKMKLISSLPSNGKAFINGDDEFIKNYDLKTKAKIITFGFSASCDCYADDIKMDVEGMKFTIHYKNKSLKVATKLMGRGNIYNILAAFSVAREYGIRDSLLQHKISILEPLDHRLKLEKIGSYNIIDDSFNSNKIGFENALEVLSYFEKPRILITPGIVEAGNMEEEINYNLGSLIKEVADEVVLVKTKASVYIGKGLETLGYNNIIYVESFKDAKKYVFDKYQKASILIENDVSDIYKI